MIVSCIVATSLTIIYYHAAEKVGGELSSLTCSKRSCSRAKTTRAFILMPGTQRDDWTGFPEVGSIVAYKSKLLAR